MGVIKWISDFLLSWIFYGILITVVYMILSKIIKGVWIDSDQINVVIFGFRKRLTYFEAELFTSLISMTIYTIWNPAIVRAMFMGFKVIIHSPRHLVFHFFLFFGVRIFFIFLAVIAAQWIISHFDLPSAGGHLLTSSNTDHGWTATITFALVLVFILWGTSIGEFANRFPL